MRYKGVPCYKVSHSEAMFMPTSSLLHAHVQVGELRQQLVEAQQHCSQQQATIMQLHEKLVSSLHQLQVQLAMQALPVNMFWALPPAHTDHLFNFNSQICKNTALAACKVTKDC